MSATTLFQIDTQRTIASVISTGSLDAIAPLWTVVTRGTGLMAFVFIGTGVAMVGHAWRLVFRSGGVLEVTSEHIANEPQDRAQRKMQRELDQGR